MARKVWIDRHLDEFGDLNTWIMLKTRGFSCENSRDNYPVIRVFKGRSPIEFGAYKTDD